MIVYITWKEVGSFINDKQCATLKEFGLEFTHWFLHLRLEPSKVADYSYARFLGFQGYLYPDVLA